MVRNIKIDAILKSMGYTVIDKDNTTLTTEEDETIEVSETLWKWGSKNTYGRNAIDFIIHNKKKNYKEAVTYLSQFSYNKTEQFNNYVLPNIQEELYIQRRYLCGAYAYNRHISNFLFKELQRQQLIAKDENENAVLLWKDENYQYVVGDDRYGTNETLYHTVGAGSRIDWGFNIKIGTEVNEIYFFDNAIELLSYMSLFSRKELENKLFVSVGESDVYKTIRNFIDVYKVKSIVTSLTKYKTNIIRNSDINVVSKNVTSDVVSIKSVYVNNKKQLEYTTTLAGKTEVWNKYLQYKHKKNNKASLSL